MNKRKGRGTSIGKGDRAGPPRASNPKTPDKEIKENAANSKDADFRGIYANARFTHTLTSLIGNVMRVETQSCSEYEGIFKTFSENCEMVLDLAHKIDPNLPDCVDAASVEEKMVFPIKNVVRFYAVDVDLDYATKETFLTDSQISGNKVNGELTMKELERWQPEEDMQDAPDLEGESQAANGWSVHEMFAKNEQFGVKTSYDPNMPSYTVQLNREKIDSQEYRDKVRQAERIAAEIEGSEWSRSQVEMENGDEEEAFSAVTRPDRRGTGGGRERESPADDKSSTYVPPGRRESTRGHSRGGGRGGQRTTPPGSRTTPPPRHDRYDHRENHNEDFRYNRHERDGRERSDRFSGGRGGYREGVGGGGHDRGYNDARGYKEDGGRGGYKDDAGRGGYNKEEGGRGGYKDEGGRGGYKDEGSRGGYKEEGGRGGYKDEAGRGGYKEDNRGYKDDSGRGYKEEGRGGGGGYKEEGRGGGGGYKEEGRGYKEEGRSYGGGQYNRQDSHPGKDHKAFSPQQQPRPGSSHDQRKEDKKPEKVTPVPELTVDKSGPDRRRSGEYSKSPENQVDAGGLPQRDQRKRGEKTKEQNIHEFKEFQSKFILKVGEGGAGGPAPLSPTTPTVSIKGRESPQPLGSPVAADTKIPTPRPSPKPTTPTGPQQVSPPQPSQGSSPPSSSLTDTLKKSTLNPNAKEFTLNPTAKEFTPRSVMAPRPQTPGTPGQGPSIMYTNINPTMQGQTGPGQIYVPGVQHATYITANNNSQRPIRPSSKEGGHSLQQRPDHPSPIQVQQMTGPPLMAPTMQLNYGFQPNMVYHLQGPGQPPMRLVAPGMMPALMPNMMSVGGPNPGIDTMSQTMANNQYQQHTSGQQVPPPMWSQVMPSHAGQPHHHNGPPVPTHNNMAPTPPAQGHTPAPSPGPQTIIHGFGPHGGHTAQPGSLPYSMIIMNSPNMGYHQSAPPMGPGQIMGPPVTSIANMGPHFQYIPHQGGQPLPSNLPQLGHHQQ